MKRTAHRKPYDNKSEKNNNEHSNQFRRVISNNNVHQAQYSNYKPVFLKPGEPFIQPDTPQQEFASSIFKAMDIIPDVPFDVSDYKPQQELQTPSYYPQSPNMRLLQPDFFSLYDVSTLFYIFFYFPGTAQQLSSGNELQQRGWVFHTKYQTWFHRIGEPTEKNEKFEVGKFEYFDHTTQDCWCVRQRNSFKLDYECLKTE
ncbi:hypothetical protein TRFO_11201 [Tritrichomonas foetus]|uniref:NOT2/NOT3/NOT5 C-terminal domain-containing protein n=1 Tax=Tritrichomonas foetus TaxID=1144522 RepID=A0A1J4J4U5_9EUKA|nr:hypothetical protein TRFO_11201 [Tritrichomonas foetus]|eukprot:OHS94342.1 hypothetical protein TRFO_11201 [Tritrichomonas foetus]